MRHLLPSQLQEVDGKTGVLPVFLVEVTLDQPYQFSTRQSLSWDGKDWIRGSLFVDDVDGESATIRIENIDNRFSLGAISGDYSRNPIKIWWGYGVGQPIPYVESGYVVPGYVNGPLTDDVELLFSGTISSTPKVDGWMTIQANRTTVRGYPKKRVRPPLANHAAVEGAVVVFGGVSHRLEGGNN